MINIEEAMLRKASEDLMRNIDFNILCETLEPFGWTVLKVEYGNDQRRVDVKNWAADNFEDEHQEHNGTWLIKSAKDATIFTLKWICQ